MPNIKYTMVGYLSLLLLVAAFYFHDLGMLARGLIVVLFYTVFDLLWTYWRDRVWYWPISSWISALVLAMVMMPNLPLIFLIFLPFLAVVCKQIFHGGKDRHLLNPAASALALAAFFQPTIAWWGVSVVEPFSLLFIFIVISALIIIFRQHRWHVVIPFLIIYGLFMGADSLLNGVVIFFASVMLIEPMTSKFVTKRQEVIYGGLVGLLAGIIIYININHSVNLLNLDPLIFGLLLGNLIASLLFLPKKNHKQGSSFWFQAVPDRQRFPTLSGEKQTEVIIVGGGIAGVSTAYFLSKAGIKTILLEVNNIGSGDTGYTTGWATRLLDSLDATLSAWECSGAAMDLLRQTIKTEKIDCEWQDVDAICFTRQTDERALSKLRDITQQLQAKDAEIEYLEKDVASQAVGFPVTGAYRKKATEGMFHVRKFLLALVERARQNGGEFFEGSEVIDIKTGDKIIVKTKTGSVSGAQLIVATGQPLIKFFPAIANLLYSSISYVIDVKFKRKQPLKTGLFWDDNDPYHYLRSVGNNEFLLGGEDWQTNDIKATTNPHQQLQFWLKSLIGHDTPFKIVSRWQGSVFSTPDSLPLIGAHVQYGKNIIFLTGWAGNGLAQGFFGGQIIADLIAQKNNQFKSLFDPNRAFDLSKIVTTKLPVQSFADALADNKGKIVEVAGQKLAVIKTATGVKAFSTKCPHLGCQIEWNDDKNTWDCPCHQSRFRSDGTLERGPAKRGLDEVKIKVDGDNIQII